MRFIVSLFMLLMLTGAANSQTQQAIFAGGCFWCVESDFDAVPGVKSTTSGYTGGQLRNPTYQNHEGHREAVLIEFDPARVSYDELVKIFFRTIDPTDGAGQFCDRGHAYTTAIYALDSSQKKVAAAARKEAESALGRNIVTPIESAGTFWPAEGYHQNYYTKNPFRYKFYRNGCRRDTRVRELWGNMAFHGIPTH